MKALDPMYGMLSVPDATTISLSNNDDVTKIVGAVVACSGSSHGAICVSS